MIYFINFLIKNRQIWFKKLICMSIQTTVGIIGVAILTARSALPDGARAVLNLKIKNMENLFKKIKKWCNWIGLFYLDDIICNNFE